MVHVVLAGGGTAGHTSPLIATAHQLEQLDPAGTRLAVGTPKGLETSVVPAAGLNLRLIPPVPLPRTLTTDLLRVPGRLRRATAEARRVLQDQQADVVVGFGGYVALPVYLAAWRMRVPVVLHEQNAVPGLANRVAARFAHRVYTSFPGTPLPRARYLGMPLRAGITELDRHARRPAARHAFGLAAHRPTLLVSGGSQGARSINDALLDARPALLKAGVQVLHVLGPKNFNDAMVSIYDDETGACYQPVAYVDAMEDAYAAADLMLGRSGAGTVHETAAVGLPALFVPLPHGNGEQGRNATPLVRAGGAVLIPDVQLTGERLVREVVPLIGDGRRLHAMTQAQRALVPRDAAATLATAVLQAGSHGAR